MFHRKRTSKGRKEAWQWLVRNTKQHRNLINSSVSQQDSGNAEKEDCTGNDRLGEGVDYTLKIVSLHHELNQLKRVHPNKVA